jgi:hypothetical protein
MDELLLDRRLPRQVPLQGTFDHSVTGDSEMGWRAVLSLFEAPPNAGPGSSVLERVQVEVWWGPEDHRRTLSLDGFRRAKLVPQNLAPTS